MYTQIKPQTKAAVQQTFLALAREEGVRLPEVDLACVHQRVFGDAPVGGMTLYYVERIKAAMVTELIQDAIVKRVAKERIGLAEINLAQIHEDVFGKAPVAAVLGSKTYRRIERVWYDLRVREWLARRPERHYP